MKKKRSSSSSSPTNLNLNRLYQQQKRQQQRHQRRRGLQKQRSQSSEEHKTSSRSNHYYHLLPFPVFDGAATYVLAWKRGIAILTAGNVKVTPDSRVHLSSGYTLQIKDAKEQDAGDYICQIATIDPREITHHVEILGSFTRFISKYPSILLSSPS